MSVLDNGSIDHTTKSTVLPTNCYPTLCEGVFQNKRGVGTRTKNRLRRALILANNSRVPFLQVSQRLKYQFCTARYVFLHTKIPLQRHTLLCSILFGMKGRESDFPTYLLHYYII